MCDKPIRTTSVDMHEVIFTRGNVRGAKIIGGDIYVAENCVNVHHGECHRDATSTDGRRKCILYLLRWEGYGKIQLFLACLDSKLKGNDAGYAILELNQLFREVSNEQDNV